MNKVSLVGLLMSLVLSGCATTYSYNPATGEFKTKSYRNLKTAKVTKYPDGRIEFLIEGVQTPLNEAIGELIRNQPGIPAGVPR